MIKKSGSAKWSGGIKDGTGRVSTETGVLKDAMYGFGSRFKGEQGTNPEELIGAAHAACFSMALSGQLENAGVKNVKIESSSHIGIEKDGDGFTIRTAHLTTRITGDGDKDKMRAAAEEAKAGCPVSKVLNADITMDVTVNANA